MKIRYLIIGSLGRVVQKIRKLKLYTKGYKNIARSAIIERDVLLDRVNPAGIFIGKHTLVAGRVIILSHEHVYRDSSDSSNPYVTDTIIGDNCFIGMGAIILPGVIIGSNCVIGAGSVVTKSIPANTFAAGNPAKKIKNVELNEFAWIIKKSN